MKNIKGFKYLINELWMEMANRTTDLQDEIATCEYRLDRNHQMTQQQLHMLAESMMQLHEAMNGMLNRLTRIERTMIKQVA